MALAMGHTMVRQAAGAARAGPLAWAATLAAWGQRRAALGTGSSVLRARAPAVARAAAAWPYVHEKRPTPRAPQSDYQPGKSLGQNVISDPNTVHRIVKAFSAAVQEHAPEGPYAPVVELCPGMGALTEHLYEEFPSMTAVEHDSRAVEILQRRMPTLQLMQQDILRLDLQALAARYRTKLNIIGNLPYSTVSGAVRKLVSSHKDLRLALVMVQKEVAAKMVAQPRSGAYGRLAVDVQLRAKAKKLFEVPPTAFYPQSQVTSAMVLLTFPETSTAESVDQRRLAEVVEACFSQRKKPLKASLRQYVSQRRLEVPKRFAKLRAEQLSPSEYVELTRQLFEM